MANRWRNNGNSDRLYFGGPQITADCDCSHEIKRWLLLGRKAMTNLDGILKSKDITLPTKVRLVKVMVFPVVMYGSESWTIKKAECWRIDAFELWCWRRHLRVPWGARRSNQSILKEISPGCSLEGLMLKLKLQYFGHLMQRTDSLEKTLMLGKIEDRKRRGQQDEMFGWHYQLDGHEFEQASRVGDRQGGLACCSPWGCKESDTTEWLNWTELGHHCCAQAFSSCSKGGLLSSFSEQASHCGGLSCWASPVAQLVKNPPANAEDARNASSIPGWEDPLEKEMQPTLVFLPEKFHV